MSDLNEKIKQDLKEDPLAGAVNKIAEHVVQSDRDHKAAVEAAEKKAAHYADG